MGIRAVLLDRPDFLLGTCFVTADFDPSGILKISLIYETNFFMYPYGHLSSDDLDCL